MKMKLLRTLFLHAGMAFLFTTAALAQTTAFSYQGRLTEAGALANGLYDFRLFAYNADAGGSQVGATLLFEDVPVANGVFVVYPDFGPGVFTGQPRWIEVGVRAGASIGIYTTLSPRQPVLATPVAQVANTVLELGAGSVGNAQLAPGAVGTPQLADGSVTTTKLADASVNTTKLADGAVAATKLAPASVGTPQLADASVTTAKLANGAVTTAILAPSSVGAGQLADGSITTAKLAPSVAAGMGGTPSGALLAAFESDDTSLLINGYVKIPSYFITVGGWSGIVERNVQTNNYSATDGTASLWTGTELFVYGRDPFNNRYAGTRLNPLSGLWNPLPTNSEPRFTGRSTPTRFAPISLVLGGSNVFAFGEVDTTMDNTNSTGGYFDLINSVWRNIPTNGFTHIYDDEFGYRGDFFWTGSEVLAVGSVNSGREFGGALFSPATNGWRLINPNGNPQVVMDTAIVGWTGTEVFIYGVNRTNSAITGGLYHPGTATWRAATTHNGPLMGNSYRIRTLWTGVELIGFVCSDVWPEVPSRFFAYNPQLDAWRPCSTNGMPALLGGLMASAPRLFWTGTEVGMVERQGMAGSYKAAVYFYHPTSDTWRSFVSDTPSIFSSASDLTRIIAPHWTGSETVAYLPVSEVGNPSAVFRPFRFTPPRRLFFYQKP